MKQEHIAKIAHLIAHTDSQFRMGSKGEFRLGGSTFATGTFEIVVHYNENEVSCSGYMGKQYLQMTQVTNSDIDVQKPSFKAKITRRNGAFIKNDVHLKNEERDLIKFFSDWTHDVELDNK